MKRRRVPVGKAGIRFEIEDGDVLRAVILPKKVPAGFDKAELKAVVKAASHLRLGQDGASDFARSVRKRMAEIPPGKTMTYGAIAEALGRSGAARAVGSAVGANQLLIVVPCHRVVAKTGLGGFREGLAWKRKLLELEQR